MPGIPLAHPLAIMVSMPVTDPASACSVTVPSLGAVMLNVMSALPTVSVASSANGATGRSSGTLTRARSEAAVDGEHRGPEPAAVGADHPEALQSREAVGGRGHQAALGDGHPDQRDDPVAGVRLQLHHGPAGRRGRRRHLARSGAASVVTGISGALSLAVVAAG